MRNSLQAISRMHEYRLQLKRENKCWQNESVPQLAPKEPKSKEASNPGALLFLGAQVLASASSSFRGWGGFRLSSVLESDLPTQRRMERQARDLHPASVTDERGVSRSARPGGLKTPPVPQRQNEQICISAWIYAEYRAKMQIQCSWVDSAG